VEELPRDRELMNLSLARAGHVILTTLKEVVIDSSLSSTFGSEHHTSFGYDLKTDVPYRSRFGT
jgi:hypothetical protein